MDSIMKKSGAENKEKKSSLGILHGKRGVIIGIAAGIVLIAVGTFWNGSTPKKTAEASAAAVSVSAYTETLEKRISSLVESIGGVSQVSVLLTMDGGSEYVYAQNGSDGYSNGALSSTAREYLIVQRDGEEDPVLIQEIYPKIRGVAVVCAGGEDIQLQIKITELLSTALGISSSRISVAGR